MRGIFVHLLEAEDSWLHYDVSGKTWPYSDRDPSAFKSFDEIAAYDRELGERTRKFLEEMTDEGLARMVSFEWRDRKVESSVENILIHTFIDEVAHIGSSFLYCGKSISNLHTKTGLHHTFTRIREIRHCPVLRLGPRLGLRSLTR